ncbi:MAG: hypothetical protein ACR2HG_12340 [Pyrinomonadaceae bacterium]
MNKKDFKDLLESVKEVGLMEKGKLEPSREYRIENESNKNSAAKAFAICLTTEDEELILMKIYSVILHPHLKTCTVKDENNETLVCPIERFLPVEFTKNIERVLEKAESELV